jgi:hypothetical protein
VNVTTYKNIAAVLCVTALAIPAGVAAQGPSSDHGKSGDQHGKNQKAKHVNSRCKHQPKVGFSLGGTLDPASTADAIVVDVTHANKHSKPFVTKGTAPAPDTYSVPAGSKVTFEGANPFTTAGADLTKYRVQVGGKVVKLKKGCTADTSPDPTVKRVKITAPDAQATPEEQSTTPAS